MRSQLFRFFALGQLAVHDDDIVAETAQESAHDLAGQGDFRHQDDDLLSLSQYLLGKLHIDFRLAAARNAVEDVGFFRLHRLR